MAPVEITDAARLSVVVAVFTANLCTVPKVEVFTPSRPTVASFVTVRAVPVALSVVAPCSAIAAVALPIVVVVVPVVLILVTPRIVLVEPLLPIPMVVVLAVPTLTVPAPVLLRANVPLPFDCNVSPVFEVLALITGLAPLNVRAVAVNVFVLYVPAVILPLFATVKLVAFMSVVYVPFKLIAFVAVPFELVIFNRLVVVPPAPFLLSSRPSVCVPLVFVPVMLAMFDAVADEPVAVIAEAAPV